MFEILAIIVILAVLAVGWLAGNAPACVLLTLLALAWMAIDGGSVGGGLTLVIIWFPFALIRLAR